ncbi:MAG: YbaB/EbfC family nucleoid-associated protein [Deltaproteobacteria bacterium]|nr:YbaB/EbfC family nucleoid-associated protein [Deltaproteobacteria bacterium]
MKVTDIMKQAQELQQKLKAQQDELAHKEYEAASGGGMVTAKVSGRGELLTLTIDPEVVTKEEIPMLEDLIVAAVNEALKRVTEAQTDEMASMMGSVGLKIPGF